MGFPIGAGDPVFDERLGGCRVGDAQQCFGQAQQRHALARAKAVLFQEVRDLGPWRVRGAGGANKRPGAHRDTRGKRRRQRRGVQQGTEHRRFRGTVKGA